MLHSPRITRSQARDGATASGEESTGRTPTERTPTEADLLRAAMEEIRQLKEERHQQRTRFETVLQQRDEELRRLERRIVTRERQLSPSNFRASGDSGSRSNIRENRGRTDLGFKLKPDTFDGSVSLREYFAQFDLIARANVWDDSTKTVALASCLRGKARTVLETIQDVSDLEFAELKSKLELRFGEGNLSQNYYVQFTNRKQKFGEDLAALGSELDRLVRLAYPECPHEVRDKIACAQFISAIYDNFVKRTLQLENITSLSVALERAKTVKMIQGERFEKKENKNFSEKKDAAQESKMEGSNFSAGRKECWTCGKVGHFRSDCPQERGNSG